MSLSGVIMCSLLPTLSVNFHFPASASRTLLWKQTLAIMWAKVSIIAMYIYLLFSPLLSPSPAASCDSFSGHSEFAAMPLEAPAIRHFIGHKCLASLIPSLSILLHVTVWEWDKSRMVWEWDRPSVWFVTLSCQSPISVRCAVAPRPSVLWWPVTISHFSPNERFWPVCGCEVVCVCVW